MDTRPGAFDYLRLAVGPAQTAAGRIVLAADITHANHAVGRQRHRHSTSGIANLLFTSEKLGAALRHTRARELQAHPSPVHVAPRTHALNDLLPRVTPLHVVDVSGFESGFVRNDLIVEVVADPGNAGLQPQGVERGIAKRRPAARVYRLVDRLPEPCQLTALGDPLHAHAADERPANNPTGN